MPPSESLRLHAKKHAQGVVQKTRTIAQAIKFVNSLEARNGHVASALFFAEFLSHLPEAIQNEARQDLAEYFDCLP